MVFSSNGEALHDTLRYEGIASPGISALTQESGLCDEIKGVVRNRYAPRGDQDGSSRKRA